MKTIDDFATKSQIDENDICPFCDDVLSDPIMNGMHASCAEEYSGEYDEAFPLEFMEAVEVVEAESARRSEQMVDDLIRAVEAI